jgi:23S rRNA pseudoU1915 N3-methylase RlmH
MNVIAGLEGVGRGQDREALMMFMATLQQSLPPEQVMQYLNPEEAIKRLAASMGIETLNLIKTEEDRAQDAQKLQQQQMTASMMGQAGQLAKAPMLDPSKNPQALDALSNAIQSQQPASAPGPNQ